MSTAAARRPPIFARPLTSYYLLVGSALLLVAVGLVMVLSTSTVRALTSSGSSLAIFRRQAFGIALGLPAMWVAMRLPTKTVRLLAYPLLLGSLAGLILVFVPGIGVGANGSTRWLQLGPLTVQPSEWAKLALALWGADLFARKEKLLGDWRHLVVPLLPVMALLAALVMLEPDLGTTLTIVAVAFGLLWVVGAPMRVMASLGGLAVAAVGWLAVAEPYRLQRLTGFLNPHADVLGAGYQAKQGLYSLASGGWFGMGLGASRGKWGYLPNAHTDFIFAIVGEELGLAGTLVVLTLFTVLGYAGFRIAQRARDPFARLAAGAITIWLIAQALINIGAVTRLLPITGIPLPLISFGGSSLVATLVGIGVLAGIARREPGAAAALRARATSPGTRATRAVAVYYGFAPGPRRKKKPASRK